LPRRSTGERLHLLARSCRPVPQAAAYATASNHRKAETSIGQF
jgi:hypothetical protein